MNSAPQTRLKPNVSKVLKEKINDTDWISFEKNLIEKAMDKFHQRTKTDPIDFFVAWSVPPSVIAERLRRLGYDIQRTQINTILHKGISSNDERSMLMVAMMETLNDLNKTLYKTTIL